MGKLHSNTSKNESIVEMIPPNQDAKNLIWIKSDFIDEPGGEICLEELDIKVKFPKGVLPARQLITLQVDTGGLQPPLHESQFVLGPVISCKPDGQMFSKPVTISMPHSCLNLTTRWV